MSISLNYQKTLAVKPQINHQLLGINEECLLIQHFNINLLLSIGWGACLFFWLIGLPILLITIVEPWIPPYGYNDDGSNATLVDVLQGDIRAHLVYILIIVIMGGTAIAITLGMSYINLRGVKKSFSPITFNRKTQTVSIYSNGEKEEIAWQKLGARIEIMTYTSGYVPHRAMVLRLSNLGKKTQIEGNFWFESLDGSNDHSGAEGLWEYIRQFMEQGPELLKIPAEPIIGIDHLDKQPMYSYDFKGSLRSHWFWPLLRGKGRHSVTVFFALLFWPIKVVFFIPNLFTDWLWRKMCLRLLKDSTSTPKYSMQKSPDLINSNDAEKVLKTSSENSLEGLTYAEIRRRLTK